MKVEQKDSVAIPPAMCRDFNMPRSAGWTFIEALEYHREISGPSQASYLTEPLRVVPCDLALRWGLLIVSLLDETADFVFRKPEWRKGRKRPSWIIHPWAPLRLVSGNDADIGTVLGKRLVRLVRRKPRIQLFKPSIGTTRNY